MVEAPAGRSLWPYPGAHAKWKNCCPGYAGHASEFTVNPYISVTYKRRWSIDLSSQTHPAGLLRLSSIVLGLMSQPSENCRSSNSGTTEPLAWASPAPNLDSRCRKPPARHPRRTEEIPMLLAMAVLLFHPQLAPTVSDSADKAVNNAPSTISASTNEANDENPLPPATVSYVAATEPAAEPSAALPDAPVPAPAPVTAPAPVAFLKSGKPMTVSVAQLRAENHRQQMLWRGLAIASSGAATFDAWSTRHAITTAGAVEMNPL